MKVLLGFLIVVNAGLLLWSMGQDGLATGGTAAGRSINPEFIEVLPPVQQQSSKTALIMPGEGGASPGPDSDSEIGVVVSSLDGESGNASEEVTSHEPFCLMIGPYDSDIERVRISRQLEQMSIKFRQHDIEKGRITGYRVYQGPYSTDREVRDARDELGRKGVTELFLLREGNKQFISLGFFSSEGSARGHARSLTSRGISVQQRVDYATTYWLVIDDAEAAGRLKKSRFPGYPQDPKEQRDGCA